MAIEKKVFPVTGMHCASCVMNVEQALQVQPGVVAASVNLANATALVTYNEKTNAEALNKAVSAAGYGLITYDITPAELEARNRKVYRSLLRKTVWAMVFSVPLVVIGMGGVSVSYANYIMWALATPVVTVIGGQFYKSAVMQLRHMSANMDTLVALSTGIAYLFSVFNTVCPQFWTQRGLEAQVYFEASAVVIAFILTGRLLEERAKAGTSEAIKKLAGLQPDTVRREQTDGNEETVALKDVMAGDVIVVKPGEKVAVDGTVVAGASFVDESMITGEPMPVEKTEGRKVFAGTINQKGSFKFRAEQVGANTMLAQIIRKVQEAQGSKAPVQRLVDKVAAIFVPVVLVIALITLVLWLWLGGSDGLTHGLLAMVTVLVIACPCALGLATPTAIITAMGRGASGGILIRDAESLERARKINAIVLDKTGVLTEGRPQVTDIAWADGVDTGKASAILYAMEARSEHPVGMAVAAFFKELQLVPAGIEHFESITGSGVTAACARRFYFAGNNRLMAQMGLDIPAPLVKSAQQWIENANTVAWFADQDRVLAGVAIADGLKASSPAAVALMRAMGMEVYMLTGDNPQTAYVVAEQAGITEFKAEQTPMEKSAFVAELQKKGRVVAMVGDGINDAAALAQADVSIAMGRGTDIAMDVAKITLGNDDLCLIPAAILLSKKTVRIIRQNLFWAFIYNVIGIPIAAGALYPVNGFLLNPMIAGAVMALSSVSVVTNSLRLKWMELE